MIDPPPPGAHLTHMHRRQGTHLIYVPWSHGYRNGLHGRRLFHRCLKSTCLLTDNRVKRNSIFDLRSNLSHTKDGCLLSTLCRTLWYGAMPSPRSHCLVLRGTAGMGQLSSLRTCLVPVRVLYVRCASVRVYSGKRVWQTTWHRLQSSPRPFSRRHCRCAVHLVPPARHY